MERRNFDDALVGVALIGVGEDDCAAIVRANRALGDLVSRTPEELVGSSLCDLIHPADRAYAVAEFETLLNGSTRVCEGEGRLLAQDGRICWVRVHAGLFPSDGAARAVVMVRLTQISELATRAGTADR